MSVLAVIGTYQHRIDTIVCFSEGWKSGFVPCNLNKVQACTPPSFPFFFWAAWASGNDALKAEITTLVQIRLLTDFLCSQKHSKVSFELLEGFSVTAEKAAARYVSSNSKPCGLLPQALPPGCSSEVGQPVSDLRSFLYLKCFENITLLYLVFQNYRL